MTVYQEMLSKEFDIAMRLQHPGIVQTVTFEDVPSLGRCIVMEWVDGSNMKQWLEKAPSRAERIRVFNQLLDAVSYLHDLGIVHRDLKPGNIMITAVGHNVKIIDFSLADSDAHAILKQPAGTEGYISPEQSSVAKPDVRNDIYSLGKIMRQMDLGIRYAHVADKCLSPIDKRYQSITEMKAAFKSRQTVSRWTWMILGLVIVVVGAWFYAALSDKNGLTQKTLHVQGDSVSQMIEPDSSMNINVTGGHPLDVTRQPVSNTAQVKEHKPEDSIPPFLSKYANDPVWNATSDGATEVYYVLSSYLQSHKPDTLSDMMYLELDYEEMKKVGHDEIERYMNSIQSKFTKKELEEIRKFMVDDCDAYIKNIYDIVHHRRQFAGYGN